MKNKPRLPSKDRKSGFVYFCRDDSHDHPESFVSESHFVVYRSAVVEDSVAEVVQIDVIDTEIEVAVGSECYCVVLSVNTCAYSDELLVTTRGLYSADTIRR